MYWRDIGYLCTEHEQLDALGKPYKTFEKRMVYCNSKGVKRNEFYQAQAQAPGAAFFRSAFVKKDLTPSSLMISLMTSTAN